MIAMTAIRTAPLWRLVIENINWDAPTGPTAAPDASGLNPRHLHCESVFSVFGEGLPEDFLGKRGCDPLRVPHDPSIPHDKGTRRGTLQEGSRGHTRRTPWVRGVSADAVLCDSMPAMASTTEKTDVRPASDQQVRRGAGKVGSAPFEFVRWSPEAETAVVAGFDVGLMAFSVPLICRQLAAVMHRYG